MAIAQSNGLIKFYKFNLLISVILVMYTWVLHIKKKKSHLMYLHVTNISQQPFPLQTLITVNLAQIQWNGVTHGVTSVTLLLHS